MRACPALNESESRVDSAQSTLAGLIYAQVFRSWTKILDAGGAGSKCRHDNMIYDV